MSKLCGAFRSRVLLAAVLAAAALIAAGCGGSEEIAETPDVPEASATDPAKSSTGLDVLDDLPTSNPAAEDAKPPEVTGFTKGGKRVRGAEKMTLREFLLWSVRESNQFWAAGFRSAGRAYVPAYVEIVGKGKTTRTNCTGADPVVRSTSGPFYCPADYSCGLARHRIKGCGDVYLTTVWLKANALRPLGDFAVAYVVAHEWAHHVQDLLGILAARATGQLKTIQTELQADCLAGVWATSVYHKDLLEPGDVEEAATLAYRLGDDLPWDHEQAHGSPTQRARWFMTGYNTGDPGECVLTAS